MKTLLAAIDREDVESIRAALGDEFQLLIGHTLPAVRTALQGRVHAVLCGLHFDDGRLFALLELLAADERLRRLPVLCIKDAGGSLSPAIRKSISIATDKLGARGFTDLAELRAEHGEQHARACLRATVHRLLSGSAAH